MCLDSGRSPMQFSSDANAVTRSSSQMASLPSSPIESILPIATPSIAGTKRGPVPTKYPTFGGVSPTKARLAAWWVPAGGFDGQADANLRHNTSVRAENGKDDRKRLADALLDPWCSPEVGYKVPMVRISDLSLPRKSKARPRVYSASEMARIVSKSASRQNRPTK